MVEKEWGYQPGVVDLWVNDVKIPTEGRAMDVGLVAGDEAVTKVVEECVVDVGDLAAQGVVDRLSTLYEINQEAVVVVDVTSRVTREGVVPHFTTPPCVRHLRLISKTPVTAFERALMKCVNLLSVDVSSLRSIRRTGGGFLSLCHGLEAVILPRTDNPLDIGDNFMHGCVTLTTIDLSPLASATSIGTGFLSDCRSLTTLDLAPISRVPSIPPYFLCNCISLRSIAFPPMAATAIAHSFLSGCTSLTALDLTGLDNVTQINTMCFAAFCPRPLNIKATNEVLEIVARD
eukprot:TRINITY_DN31159_c0_g1_i1.p1 TRINITY_DN31159_c0_g1~~TRINITY_DN31159_c0_g1_i1.p1  ORF type:complete len:339 (+),score=86.58 TRINITY_DN31159_c0_g1_i1:151-1017(+)